MALEFNENIKNIKNEKHVDSWWDKELSKGSKIIFKRVESLDSEKGNNNTLILKSTIELNKKIDFGNGEETVLKIEKVFNKIYIKTQSGIYEIIDVQKKDKIKMRTGETADGKIIKPVFEYRHPDLNNEIFNEEFNFNNKLFLKFFINKEKLNNLLIEVDGKIIYKINKRFMVLTNIPDGGQLPFYMSSSGTDGKNEYEWYPYFGHTGSWLIKGGVASENGDMVYSDEISEMRKQLNENLIFPGGYIDNNGQMKLKGGEEVKVDLNDVFENKFYSFDKEFFEEGFLETDSDEYQKKVGDTLVGMTGFDVEKLKGIHPKDATPLQVAEVQRWIRNISEVMSFKKDSDEK